jgi:hypothetical protein
MCPEAVRSPPLFFFLCERAHKEVPNAKNEPIFISSMASCFVKEVLEEASWPLRLSLYYVCTGMGMHTYFFSVFSTDSFPRTSKCVPRFKTCHIHF